MGKMNILKCYTIIFLPFHRKNENDDEPLVHRGIYTIFRQTHFVKCHFADRVCVYVDRMFF